MKKLLMILLSLFIFTACSNNSEVEPTPTSSGEDINGCLFGEDCKDGEEVASEMMDWEIIEFADSLDYVNETAILFYSFDDCPWCIDAIPVLDEVVKETNTKIYYVHTSRDEREAGNENYDRVYAYYQSVIEEAGYDAIYMPSIFFIKDGEIVAYHVGTVDGYSAGDEEMSEDQVSELKDIFYSYIELMN